MLYDLSQNMDRTRFSTKVRLYWEKGCRVELVCKTKRTRPQNSYLHLILGWFAIESGNTLDYVKREYFKKLCNAAVFVTERDDRYLGKVKVLRSSRDLSTEEMSEAIERFRSWSSKEAGIYLPSANETDYLDEIEREMNRYENRIYY